MRRILLDHARTKHRKKRGGKGRIRVALQDFHADQERPEEIVAVDEVLELLRLSPSTPAFWMVVAGAGGERDRRSPGPQFPHHRAALGHDPGLDPP